MSRFRERREEIKKKKKNMPEYIQGLVKKHKKFVKELSEDKTMFENKGLSLGDFAYHHKFGNCVICDIKAITQNNDEMEDAIWMATIACTEGEQKVEYESLLKPNKATEVLYK
jgi:hypothetical protein